MTTLSTQRTIDAVVLTSTVRLIGGYRASRGRLSDSLNTPLTGQITMSPVTVESLYGAERERVVASSIVLKRDEVILMHLQEGSVDDDPPSNVLRDRHPYPAFMQAGPFSVRGELRPLPGRTVQQYIFETALPFLEVTQAEITFHPTGVMALAPFVMIGRHWISGVIEGAQQMTDAGLRMSGR